MRHFIGYRVFAALDSRGTDGQESSLEKALRLEFITLVPAAGRLRACELFLQRHHTDQGCRLEYYLVEFPQTGFEFEVADRPPPAGARQRADFHHDIEDVTAGCNDVKTRLVLAHSPNLGHQKLQQRTPAIAELKALRTLCRRHARQLAIPTPSGDLVLDLPAVPRHLPTGIKCDITARVAKLTPDHMAHLDSATWQPSPELKECPLPSLSPKAVARRDGLPDVMVKRLLDSMDARKQIQLCVTIAFDWATGSAKELKILSVDNARAA